MRTHALTSLRLALLASIALSPGCGGRALDVPGGDPDVEGPTTTNEASTTATGGTMTNEPSTTATGGSVTTGPVQVPTTMTPTTPAENPAEPMPSEPSVPTMNPEEPQMMPEEPPDMQPIDPERVPPATACTGSTPIETDSGSLGIERCDDGLVHRVSPAQCTVLAPRADFSIPEGLGGDCATDADCTVEPFGWCGIEGQAGWGVCHYGCETDADCGESQVCECGGVAGECVSATCATDADCGEGELCARVIDVGMCSDGFGGPTSYACTHPDDECHQAADCGEDGRCALVEGVAACAERALCGIGRPFLVHGEARLSEVESRSDYVDPALREHWTPSALSTDERRVLADHWTHVALMEHASVAAFARFSLQLLSLGAPAALVAESNAAMADELRHSQACFSLASSYAGEDVGPGPLPVEGALGNVELADVFVDVFLEGCVGETVAAVEAAEARAAASSPAVRSVLDVVQVEESRHAALAWKFVAWALEQSPGLRGVLQRLHDEQLAAASAYRARGESHSVPPRLAAHGYVDERTRGELRAQVIEHVVVPCCRALLDERGASGGVTRDVSAVA